MRVAVGKIYLDFYNNEKVSEKTRILEDLCKSLRKKFNISILEIDEFDNPEKGVIGFSLVFPESWKSLQMSKTTEKVCKTIDQLAAARVVLEDCGLLSH